MTSGPAQRDPRDTAAPSRTKRRAWELARQEHTRAALVDAATEVFKSKGYAKATISDITATAGVSQGSYYNYFRTKDDALLAVVERVHHDFYGVVRHPDGWTDEPDDGSDEPTPQRMPPATVDELVARLDRSNARFIEKYRRNAAELQILEEAGTVSPELRAFRRRLRAELIERNTAYIEYLQQQGWADPTLDAFHAASALGAMIDRFAYLWFVMGEAYDDDIARRTLSTLWLNALGVER